MCLGSQISLVTTIHELTLSFRIVWHAPIYCVRHNLQRALLKASIFGTFKLELDNILERIFKESVLYWEETELNDMFHLYTFLLFNKILRNREERIIQNSFYLRTFSVLFYFSPKDNYTSTPNRSESITCDIACNFRCTVQERNDIFDPLELKESWVFSEMWDKLLTILHLRFFSCKNGRIGSKSLCNVDIVINLRSMFITYLYAY